MGSHVGQDTEKKGLSMAREGALGFVRWRGSSLATHGSEEQGSFL